MRPSGIDCLYRKQSGVYGREYQLSLALGMSTRIESSQGCMGEKVSYCSRSGIECPYKNQSGCAGREPPAGSADIPGRQLIF